MASIRPLKTEKYRVRLTTGGNRIDYDGPTTTPTSDINLTKLFLNSVISTPNAKFISIDITDFYLHSALPTPEYMSLPIDTIPKDIIHHYNLQSITHNNKIYVKINKGLYGLKQSGHIAHAQLATILNKNGYTTSPLTPGLWTLES